MKKKKENNWKALNNSYAFQAGFIKTENGESVWSELPKNRVIKLFYNKKTGEIRIFSLIFVERHGIDEVLKKLEN